MQLRKIIHIDMDAFFASVEQRDFPELRGKPVAVGGSKERGVVAAASYEARKFGVHSAMPSVTAARKCPQLIFVKARFDVYKAVSDQIREIFLSYTDLVEPLSLDEAYLDVTENKPGIWSAITIAREIKKRIKETTGLTASAGISFNKFLAKTATDLQKPDGLTLILPDKADELVAGLPIEKFYGIGSVTAAKMKSLGIFTGADLRRFSETELRNLFGKSGGYFYEIARGIDDRPVNPNRIRKSIGSETTFATDLSDENDMLKMLVPLVNDVAETLERKQTSGKTITLKIKYADFTQTTRSKTFQSYISSETQLFDIVSELLRTPFLPVAPVRLLGVSVSSLSSEIDALFGRQLRFPF